MRADFIAAELQSVKDAGLYRHLRLVDGDQGATLTLDGREVINFSSNNYLGIANHPALASGGEGSDRSLWLRLGSVAADFRQYDFA